MKTIATITGQAYRAAYAVAPRKDCRYYLNGLYLDLDAGKLVATDGHMMYVNDLEPGDDPGDSLIFEPVKIQASAENVIVCPHDKQHVMVHVIYPRVVNSMHVCRIIEGTYPDYKAVIPTFDAGHARQDVGFDVKYLAILKQIFKKRVQFEFNSTPGACKITGHGDKEGMVVLMELRKNRMK